MVTALALFACAENGPNAPRFSTASIPAAAKISTNDDLVSTTEITATVSRNNRGHWITSDNLNIPIDIDGADLSIRRLGRFIGGRGQPSIDLRRSGSDNFTDYWSVDDENLVMTITIGDIVGELTPVVIKDNRSVWGFQTGRIIGSFLRLRTGDTFRIKIEQTGPPKGEEEPRSMSDIIAARDHSDCSDALLELDDPSMTSGYDLDVWNDTYDSCFSDIMTSNPEFLSCIRKVWERNSWGGVGCQCDHLVQPKFLTKCERLSCYAQANCAASGGEDCVSTLLRESRGMNDTPSPGCGG